MEMNQYLDIFIDESKQHLQNMYDYLLKVENGTREDGVVHEIFRSAHTLKGMAATMGYEHVTELTHGLENILDELRNEKIDWSNDLIDLMFQAVEELSESVDKIVKGEGTVSFKTETLIELHEFLSSPSLSKEREEKPLSSLSINDDSIIKIHLSEDCLLKGARAYMVLQKIEEYATVIKTSPSFEEIKEGNFTEHFIIHIRSEEPFSLIQKEVMHMTDVKNVELHIRENKKEAVVSSEYTAASETVRVKLDDLNVLMNLVEELVIDRTRIQQMIQPFSDHDLDDTVKHLFRLTNDLQQVVINMRMVPIETVFKRFPPMVRNLARTLGKKIRVKLTGQETALDRTIVEKIGDPLVHLIRNSIDHGIEHPEQRRENGKELEGTIELSARYKGSRILIEIKDDGSGINRQSVLAKAISKNIVSNQKANSMLDEDVYQLLFTPGFSTADEVSNLSGRGVGLDVVRNSIEALGGTTSVASKSGQGTVFSIDIPATLSIVCAMLIKMKEDICAVPISSIAETLFIEKEEILHIGEEHAIHFRNKVIPLFFLNELFEYNEEQKERLHHYVVILEKGEKYVALGVDGFLHQQDIVVKPLSSYLKHVSLVSGATILGDGKVALILNHNELFKDRVKGIDG
ncbi:chemotaxis protein CheA [Priestia endophytica]|uniref:chemotaxis protein CheA n=1 Tax=Priestia endophytica TaxID=135735 RepID=UPI00124E14DE|nr:chemotaxis protein CheA [Priestia endophytica]KAB2494678.1 chemotaxis protein CheA [Priestia endophytica]